MLIPQLYYISEISAWGSGGKKKRILNQPLLFIICLGKGGSGKKESKSLNQALFFYYSYFFWNNKAYDKVYDRCMIIAILKV